jgi:hypothetical protein
MCVFGEGETEAGKKGGHVHEREMGLSGVHREREKIEGEQTKTLGERCTIQRYTILSSIHFYRLTPSIGTTEKLPAMSCKEIRDMKANECDCALKDGMYWINKTDPCMKKPPKIIKVCVCVPVGTVIGADKPELETTQI